MSKGWRRNFIITTNDFSSKYVLITVLVVIMPMYSLINLLPQSGDYFFSAWVRAGPSYRITSNKAHWSQGPSDLMHWGGIPPLWCSSSDFIIPLNHEKTSDKPKSGDNLQGIWAIVYNWSKSWKTRINWGRVTDCRRPRRHIVQCNVDTGLDPGMEERVSLKNWWNWNKIRNAVNGIVPVSISLDHCIIVM